jgi:ribosome-interacting GTPase 1
VGIRLNKSPPQIAITPTKLGGVKLNSTKALTHLNEKVVKNILSEYKIHNADVLVHDDSTVDDFIDVVEGNRKYIKCLYCYNKIDTISMEEVNMIAEQPNTVVISCNMKLNFDGLLEKIWEHLDLDRVYTKKPK